MRILLVVPAMRGGGAEFVARTWAGWLSEHGNEVHVHTTAEFTRPPELPDAVRWYPGARGGHRATQRQLRSTVRSARPTVILALQMYANLNALLLRIGPGRTHVPVVVSERNLVSIGLSSASASHRSKVAMARRLYRRADHVAAISHPVAAEMVSAFGVDPDRCTVVPNPAAAKVSSLSDHGDPVLRGQRRIVLVFPCRLVQQKRPLLAVDVAAELDRRGFLTTMLVFGTGPLESSMRERAEQAGVQVVFGGWQEEWFARCSRGSVLLVPSLREGFGNTLVEAAAAGVRSVAFSGALGVSDAVVPGITGTLTATDTAAGLADGVEAEYGRSVEGADDWLSRFSPDRSGAAIDALLHRVQDGGQ
ncbi:MAG: glycosyltransferase family 4 protein [Rhodococcus sp. (in: high G+C Gram-positive bacteria)]